MKKVLLMSLSMILVAAMAMGITVAYLQDEDSAVNVMTMGNVYIEQHEYERAQKDDGTYETVTSAKYGEGYKLQAFTQDKPLYPAVFSGTMAWGEAVYFDQLGAGASGGQKVLDGVNNIQDHFVLIENTGKSPAYVRTLIAYEVGSVSAEKFDELVMTCVGDAYISSNVGIIDVDGNNYFVIEYLYQGTDVRHTNGVLPAGEFTYNSLSQIYFTPEVTNEDCDAFDGNDNGKYDVVVLSQAIQTAGFEDAASSFSLSNTTVIPAAKVALDSGFGEANVPNAQLWFTGIIPDVWDGETVDTSWYNDADTEFELTAVEQLAGLAELVDDGETFEGKTVKLNRDFDLAGKLFDPIGSYRKDTPFKGTFDGQGHTIANLSQNTWELNNGYYYGDLGLGLFGKVEDAKVTNLVMDGASISGESAIVGIVAGTAYGDCTFENITVKNSQGADYQYYAGGVVGWASGNHDYKNITIDESTTLAAQWGDFDNSTGGVIGGAGSSAEILMKDCTVACRIDAYNDVTSTYQWYAYRRCGMLIGNSNQTVTEGGTTYAAAPQLTCENVTVIYGDWANYTYCEFAGTSWPYVRVQAGVSNSAYSNPRYGHPTDANGNPVVDDNHVHNDGEDHFIACTFDQLYGGGQGVYGDATHDGVTVIYNNK